MQQYDRLIKININLKAISTGFERINVLCIATVTLMQYYTYCFKFHPECRTKRIERRRKKKKDRFIGTCCLLFHCVFSFFSSLRTVHAIVVPPPALKPSAPSSINIPPFNSVHSYSQHRHPTESLNTQNVAIIFRYAFCAFLIPAPLRMRAVHIRC